MKIIKTTANPVKTVLTICLGFLFVYVLSEQKWLLYAALFIGLTGVFSTYLSSLIDTFWMKLAWLLGMVVPNIILGVVFYLLVFPLSLLSRLFGRKDFLTLKNRKSSLFVETRKHFSKTSFEKPW